MITYQDVMQALEKARGGPVLTTNQASDVAAHLNAVVGTRGEPVAWLTKCKLSGLVEQVETGELASNPEHWTDAFPVYAQPAPAAEGYKLHMSYALKVFETLKVRRLSRRVDKEDLGPLGATEIETWSTAIGVILEMQTAMGGCTLVVRSAQVAVPHVMESLVEAVGVSDFLDQQGSRVKVGVAYLFVYAMPGPDVTSLVVEQLNDDGTVGGYDPNFKVRIESIATEKLWRPVKYGWESKGDREAIVAYAGEQALELTP